MNKKTVIFQGTFDPFTCGHLAVVEDALKIFEEVIILLLINPEKTPLFSVSERKEMIEKTVAHLPGVRVDSFEGLLVEYMQEHGLHICVRGIRDEKDLRYEIKNHSLSKALFPELQTMFVPCRGGQDCVSSSVVKEEIQKGNLPQKWLPDPVLQAFVDKIKS